MMKTEEIRSELREFVRTRFQVPPDDPDFADDVDLFNYGYIDSLGAADLTAFVEGRLGAKFSAADWVKFPLSTITEISNFVMRRRLGEI
jgi:methoxymalonate biosynthesis acyl carrier protein